MEKNRIRAGIGAGAIAEIAFDCLYLLFVIIVGIYLISKAEGENVVVLYGAMALTLGFGDAFHLVPRIYGKAKGLMDNQPEYLVKALGFGKLVTSITMTGFYVILVYVACYVYDYALTNTIAAVVWSLASVRVVLCLMPENRWLTRNPSKAWGIYRNVPFLLLGLTVLFLYKISPNGSFNLMWVAIMVSFLFYMPVVTFGDEYPKLGMLMIPKTCAYIWMVVMGLSLI